MVNVECRMVNCGYIKTILEKGKTTLLPFSPYCEELHAERVNLRRIFNPAV